GVCLVEAGRAEEAVAAYREALELREPLTAGSPDSPVARSELAETRNNLGWALYKAGRDGEAEQKLLAAHALWRRLVQAGGEHARRSLAQSLHNLGHVWSRMNRRADALAAYTEGGDLRQASLALSPNDQELQGLLAWSQHYRGTLLVA